MADRPLCQQRSLWLNGEVVQEHHRRAAEEKQRLDTIAEEKAKKKQEEKERKIRGDAVLSAIHSGQVKKRPFEDIKNLPQSKKYGTIDCEGPCGSVFNGEPTPVVMTKRRRQYLVPIKLAITKVG
jgi:hypothetical protein